MNRKVFTAVTLAGLIGLGGVALESRNDRSVEWQNAASVFPERASGDRGDEPDRSRRDDRAERSAWDRRDMEPLSREHESYEEHDEGLEEEYEDDDD